MREHTTHHDDCGCLSEAKDKQISELETRVAALSEELEKCVDALEQNQGELELWKQWAKNNADEFGQVRRISKQMIVAMEASKSARALLDSPKEKNR